MDHIAAPRYQWIVIPGLTATGCPGTFAIAATIRAQDNRHADTVDKPVVLTTVHCTPDADPDANFSPNSNREAHPDITANTHTATDAHADADAHSGSDPNAGRPPGLHARLHDRDGERGRQRHHRE